MIQTDFQGSKKIKFVIFLAFMSSASPLATDMYLPALSLIKENFNTTDFYTQLSLSGFFTAFALGQLIYGPLSDKFGRKIPLIIGVFLFTLGSIGCTFSTSIEMFIFFRFVQAIGGCAGVVIARAIVNDLFELKQAAEIFALMMVCVSIAPMLAPNFGSFLLNFFSWHSIFIVLFIIGLILFLITSFGFKESVKTRNQSKIIEIFKEYKLVLKDKTFIIYTLSSSFAIATMFAYITGSEFVFGEYFKLNETHFALLFSANSLGFMASARLNSKLIQTYSLDSLIKFGLYAMGFFGLVLILANFLSIGFLRFEIPFFMIISTLGFIIPNITTLAMARFKNIAGAASAVYGTSQFCIAGFISFLVGFLGANTPLPLSIFICVCSLFAGFIYIFKKES